MSRRLTTEEFIAKAREVHGDRYDYSTVEYKTAKDKVSIVCREHGVFHVTPNNHSSVGGTGCPICSGSQRWTREHFISRARDVHGDKYDYSLVEYENVKRKVLIRCKVHNELFQQSPQSHVDGAGCPKCAGRHTPTTSEFIAMCRSVHGDTYDYSESVLTTLRSKVKITCPQHGPFMQEARKHLNGQGCPKCRANAKLSAEEILARCVSVHRGRYVYRKSTVVNTFTKMKVLCPEHGSFWQTPEEHYKGSGCPKCAANATWKIGDLLQKFREVHGDKYDYSNVVYTSTKSKIEIVCRTHGTFLQKLENHMNGCGCPKCSVTGFKPSKRGCFYLYSISTESCEHLLGFGITNSIHHRNRQHQNAFRKSCATGVLTHKFFFRSGEHAKRLEALVASSFPLVDSGICGFMREALPLRYLEQVLDVATGYHLNFKNAA